VPAHRMTNYDACMTMLSFRVDEEDAAAIQRWADELSVDRSALLRDAVRQHLNRLAAENDVDRWGALPLTEGESALATIADWGPAEDWQDWADATG
jgi:predicted transcriptional regulator